MENQPSPSPETSQPKPDVMTQVLYGERKRIPPNISLGITEALKYLHAYRPSEQATIYVTK